MLANIVVGLLVIALGVSLMAGSRRLAETFGEMQWATKNVGSTRGLYGLVGFGACVLGALFLFGVLDVSDVQDSSSTMQGFGPQNTGAVQN